MHILHGGSIWIHNEIPTLEKKYVVKSCLHIIEVMQHFFSHLSSYETQTLFVARDAWNSLGNMSKEEAMQAYVNDIQLVSIFITSS